MYDEDCVSEEDEPLSWTLEDDAEDVDEEDVDMDMEEPPLTLTASVMSLSEDGDAEAGGSEEEDEVGELMFPEGSPPPEADMMDEEESESGRASRLSGDGSSRNPFDFTGSIASSSTGSSSSSSSLPAATERGRVTRSSAAASSVVSAAPSTTTNAFSTTANTSRRPQNPHQSSSSSSANFIALASAATAGKNLYETPQRPRTIAPVDPGVYGLGMCLLDQNEIQI